MNKPSKPRDAASVIIYKEMYNKYYVLMGKRPIKSKFMPSIYVFLWWRSRPYRLSSK